MTETEEECLKFEAGGLSCSVNKGNIKIGHPHTPLLQFASMSFPYHNLPALAVRFTLCLATTSKRWA